MKKIVILLLSLICAVCIVYFGIQISKSNSVAAIELQGEMQTLYFVNETNDVNFNGATLLVTYKDGTKKEVKLSKKTASIKYFDTTIAKAATMKISYKSHVIDVDYDVINPGLYYLKNTKTTNLNSTNSITSSVSSNTFVGLNTQGTQDNTTATNMIYFYSDGKCDYYTRTSSTATWYVDDGHYDSNFFYTINGNVLTANIGKDKKIDFIVEHPSQGVLNLKNIEKKYIKNGNTETEFLTEIVENNYEFTDAMKETRVVESVEVFPNTEFTFSQGSTYEESSNKIYISVKYKNDVLLSNVRVRYNPSMLKTEKEFSTENKIVGTYANCYYKGLLFRFYYSVV